MEEDNQDLSDLDREEIARQVQEGYTSGRIDDGEGKHIAWTLNINSWID